jgi:phosphoglycerate dehydrogenase-like enzyme
VRVLLNFHLASDVRLPVPEAMLATLRSRFPGVTFVGADDAETMAREAAVADVFFGWRFPPELLPGASRLRWIQAASAGVEGTVPLAGAGREIALTNVSGIAADAIAEHVLAMALAFCRNLHVALRLQRERRWDRLAVMGGGGTPVREFAGSHVAVLGLGPVGVAVARRAAALGAVVRGLRRHPGGPVPPCEEVVGPSRLLDLLGWARFAVLALPHTPETAGLLGARELAALGSEGYLLNVARGSVVDEAALVAALRDGSIAGAGLDVCAAEPLGAGNPLWAFPNVIVTPHMAGAIPGYFERALEVFVENLERFLAGRSLRNLVDPVLGYPRSRDA